MNLISSRSQRQLAARTEVSLGKGNYSLRARVERGLVKLGNISTNPNKGKHANILTSATLEKKHAVLKPKEAEFEGIQREIETLKADLEPTKAALRRKSGQQAPSCGTAP